MPKAERFRYAILGTTVLLILIMNFACAHGRTAKRAAGDACLQREIKRLASLPEKEVITTLDGQQIHLDHFGNASSLNQPGCSLPYKFYHWPNETKEVVSKALLRSISHRIRAYYNLTSICYPEKREEGQMYGDVAEFYDGDLIFMGFAVYVGNGLYCPLPHAGYTGPASLEAAMIYGNRSTKMENHLNERKEG
jgi:hypothetical protein